MKVINSGDAWEKAVDDGIKEEFIFLDNLKNCERSFILGHLDGRDNWRLERDQDYQPLMNALDTIFNRGNADDWRDVEKALKNLKPLITE